MKTITRQELDNILKNSDRSAIDLKGVTFENMDLSKCDFHGIKLRGAIFKNTDLTGSDFRGSDLTGANIQGANLYCAILEQAVLDEIVSDGDTKFFRMVCPETGAFIGWKKCFNYRIVQLLIPEGAKRSSATDSACRCDRAKVLTIKSIDYKHIYKEARSYVNENFVYRSGEMVYSSGFCDDRWKDSTTGIHFFMTRAEAIGYL